MYGVEGERWVKSLPAMVEKYTKEWNLAGLQAVDELSMNYVLRGSCDHEHIILKIGFEKESIAREALALRAFAGHGCVRLLKDDVAQGVLLLQCAMPGTNLKAMFPDQDKQATHIAAMVIKKLQSVPMPVTDAFPTLADWLSVLDNDWEIPRRHLRQARDLRDYLLSSTTAPVLLHGDLHHSNIIADGTDWLAIDPKGVIGDPAYEANCFIRNPLPEIVSCPVAQEITVTRLHDFSQLLGFDPQRMLCWCYVQSIVSACWFIQNNGDPAVSIKLADIIEQIKSKGSF